MYELIEHKKLDSAAASITFSNIPQIYTDLMMVVSDRTDRPTANDGLVIKPNNESVTSTYVYGTGTSVVSGTESSFQSLSSSSFFTANTFSNHAIYFSKYTSSANKSIGINAVTENNGTQSYQWMAAGLYSSASPITSIVLQPLAGTVFLQHSSATLYGINRTSAIGRPKAIGGNITYANGYWVHTFTGSGTFYAQEDLEVDALLVAGGGGASRLGGGGAGGLLTAYGASVSAGSYPIVIGGGGLGVENSIEYNGSDSTFLSYRAIGGGAGSSTAIDRNGQAGGSGGGAWPVGTGGAGTSGQGNAGGSAGANSPPYGGGGGGGAGAVGSNQQGGNIGGPGGAGLAYGITGNTVYYAGGGAGGDTNSNSIAGGIGGGGSSPNNKDGTPNTGGGAGAGGGPLGTGGNGGSGVVIVRYRA